MNQINNLNEQDYSRESTTIFNQFKSVLIRRQKKQLMVQIQSLSLLFSNSTKFLTFLPCGKVAKSKRKKESKTKDMKKTF